MGSCLSMQNPTFEDVNRRAILSDYQQKQPEPLSPFSCQTINEWNELYITVEEEIIQDAIELWEDTSEGVGLGPSMFQVFLLLFSRATSFQQYQMMSKSCEFSSVPPLSLHDSSNSVLLSFIKEECNIKQQ